MIDREKMLRWLNGQGAIEEIDRDYWGNHLDTEKAREFRNRASANIAIIEAIETLIRTAPEPEDVRRLVEISGDAVTAFVRLGILHLADVLNSALAPFTKGESRMRLAKRMKEALSETSETAEKPRTPPIGEGPR